MNTTTELAQQLRELATSDRPELDAEERAALQDAATRLDKGQGAVYTIGRLLAPFLGRLVKRKPQQLAWVDERPGADLSQQQVDLVAARWDAMWGERHRAVWRQPKDSQR